MHVAGREIESLGAGWRHDVRGVAGQEHPPEPHRLGDETAQRCDALFNRGPGNQPIHRLLIQPPLQFIPEPLIRPLVDMVLERALYVVAAAMGRAHRAERKPASMI